MLTSQVLVEMVQVAAGPLWLCVLMCICDGTGPGYTMHQQQSGNKHQQVAGTKLPIHCLRHPLRPDNKQQQVTSAAAHM